MVNSISKWFSSHQNLPNTVTSEELERCVRRSEQTALLRKSPVQVPEPTLRGLQPPELKLQRN